MTDRGPAQGRHVPVMRDRILDLLAPALERPGAVHVDATLGMGGHAEGVLERFPESTVVGIDRDREALALSGERLARFGDRFRPVHAVYDEIEDVVADLHLPAVDGILFDLGVSSLQLDEADRGFAYRVDAPLDMRMDQSTGRRRPTSSTPTRWTTSPGSCATTARSASPARSPRPSCTTAPSSRSRRPAGSSSMLRRVIPAASQRQSGHPAKRTFQALRIEVNDELEVWRRAIDEAIDVLAVGGRIAVLSYHSLEDRATKRAFAAGATSSTPPGLPVELPEHAAYLSLVTRGAEAPDDAEVAANPRAASARLRVAERVRDQPAAAPPAALQQHRQQHDSSTTQDQEGTHPMSQMTATARPLRAPRRGPAPTPLRVIPSSITQHRQRRLRRDLHRPAHRRPHRPAPAQHRAGPGLARARRPAARVGAPQRHGRQPPGGDRPGLGDRCARPQRGRARDGAR